MDEIQQLLAKVGTSAHVRAAFGEPYQVNGKTLIPVARVRMGMGVGGGRGKAGKRATEGTEPKAEGEGGGGGGMLGVTPVAVVEVSGDKIRMLPVVDVTRLAVGGMLLAGWAVFWFTRMAKAVRTKALEARRKEA